ncbi:MAG: serpin family protein [Myxococcales bacterium]|nr:serpin family protein [Myxococcales bacterium]
MRPLLLASLVLGLGACEKTTNPKVEPGNATTASVSSAPPLAGPSEVASAPPSTPPSTPSSSAPTVTIAMPSPTEVKPHATGSNAFAFDLYARIGKAPGNQVFSPASMSIALAMTWAGAKGETAAQMKKVMHFEAGGTAMWGRISQALNAPGRPFELRSANRLFGEKTYKFEQPFLDGTKASFGAPLEPVDFKVGYEAARGKINGWVEEQTKQRIKDLLPKGALDELTRLVLVNAIYFLADWADPFEKNATYDADFEGPTKKKVPTMHRSGSYAIAQVDQLKVLELPYGGSDISMLVVLPDSKTGLGAVEKSLTAAKLEAWTKALAPNRVDVALPRFEVSPASMPLADELQAMGMPLAFDRKKADFTLMGNPPNPDEHLCIQKVFHKAFVKVDEKGTEAAAATAVVMGAKGGAAPQKAIEFRADHPFLFFVVDKPSGLVLFMGRVVDPAAK